MKDTPQSLLEDVKNNLPLLYDVEEDYQVSLLKYSENIIYKVEFSKSSPVVFRIHRPGYHDIEELEGEISWMDEIHKDTQVRLPVVYRGRDGGFNPRSIASSVKSIVKSPFCCHHVILSYTLNNSFILIMPQTEFCCNLSRTCYD